MDATRRKQLVFGVCFPLRFALVAISAWLGYGAHGWHQMVLGLLVAAGFLLNQLLRSTGLRQERGFGGGEVYWHSWIHALLFVGFAYAIHQRAPRPWLFLLADVLYGLVTVVAHYYL